MTPWFRLTLVCCVLLCLLLGLTQAVDWNYQPVVSSGSSFDRGTKATSDSPTRGLNSWTPEAEMKQSPSSGFLALVQGSPVFPQMSLS
jgi:hypothetical protein